MVIPVRQAHLVQGLSSLPLRLRPGHSAGQQPFRDILESGFIQEEIVILKYKPCPLPNTGNLFLCHMSKVVLLPVKPQGSAVRLLEKIQTSQQGGLACSAGAYDCRHISLVDPEMNIF